MGVRKLLEFFFTKTELKILDDTLPEFKRKEKLDDEEALEKEVTILRFEVINIRWLFLSVVKILLDFHACFQLSFISCFFLISIALTGLSC